MNQGVGNNTPTLPPLFFSVVNIQKIFPWVSLHAPGWKAYVPGRYAETKPRLKDTNSLSQALPRLDTQPREGGYPEDRRVHRDYGGPSSTQG